MLWSHRAGLWAMLILCTWRLAAPHQQPFFRRDVSANNQMGAVLDRLQSLDNSMEELKQQMAQLMKMQQGLQETCGPREGRGGEPEDTSTPGLEGSTSARRTTSVPVTCPRHPGSSDFQLTAVLKRETETHHVVTMCYVGPHPHSVRLQKKVNGDEEPVELDSERRITVRRGKADVSHENELVVRFIFDSSEVYLELDLSGEGPDEFFFEELQLKVDKNEIAYSPGEAVHVTSMLTNELNDSLVGHGGVSTTLVFKSSTEQHSVNEFTLQPDAELPEEISDVRLSDLGRQYGNATAYRVLDIPTTPDRERGLVHVQAFLMLTCSGDPCLVTLVSMTQRVVFVPRGVLKPFPDNFVGFPKSETSHPDVPGEPERVQCYENNRVRNCYLQCRAYGDSPRVNITRISNAPTSAHSDVRFEDQYISVQAWDFDSPVPSDAGSYMCMAMSADGHVTVSRMIQLTVDKVAEIQHNMTTVTVGDHGSITAVCTAQGRPLPSIRFGPYFGDPDTEVIEQADVAVLELNATTVQATFTLANWTAYDRYDVYNVWCYAKNRPHDEDYMRMPLVDSP